MVIARGQITIWNCKDGEDAYSVSVSPSSCAVPSSSDGVVPSEELGPDSNAVFTVSAFRGTVALRLSYSTLPATSGECTWRITTQAGVSCAHISGTADRFCLTGLNADSATAVIVFDLEGKSTSSFYVNVVKQKEGSGSSNLGHWHTGLHVSRMAMVRMGRATWQCPLREGTENPPLWCWTDKYGNRFTFDDGMYLLTGDENEGEYELVSEDGKDPVSVLRVDVEYAASSSGIVPPASGWQTESPSWVNGQYIWSRTAIYYSDDTVTYTHAVCISGGKGIKKITEYYYRSTSPVELVGGEWGTEYPGWINGTWIWTRSVIEYTDGTAETTLPTNVTGSSGEGFSYLGRWYTGLKVPYLGAVRMGGNSLVCMDRRGTENPPLWCWTDKYGNRFTFDDGDYVLTGDENGDEYELLVPKGDDGKDAVGYEYIYRRSSSGAPSTPSTSQDDGYVPSGWSDVPQGVSDEYPNEYISQRKRSSDGIWGEWSAPKLWSQYGIQGIQGCVVRDSEWAIGTEYRNDSGLSGGNAAIRFIDVVLVRNNGVETGWDAYQCLKTHVSSSSITYTNTSYWKKFGTNVGAIFTSLIIAKNAKIKFFQGNEILIQKNDGTVTAGVSGSDTGGKIRFWAGSPTPGAAPFRVNESGKMFASDAEISGKITATSGVIGGFKIASGTIGVEGANNMWLSPSGLSFKTASKSIGIGDTLPSVTGVSEIVSAMFKVNLSSGDFHGTNGGAVMISTTGGFTYTDQRQVALRIRTDNKDNKDVAIDFIGRLNCHGNDLFGGYYRNYGYTGAIGIQHVWDNIHGRFRLCDLYIVNGLITNYVLHD